MIRRVKFDDVRYLRAWGGCALLTGVSTEDWSAAKACCWYCEYRHREVHRYGVRVTAPVEYYGRGAGISRRMSAYANVQPKRQLRLNQGYESRVTRWRMVAVVGTGVESSSLSIATAQTLRLTRDLHQRRPTTHTSLQRGPDRRHEPPARGAAHVRPEVHPRARGGGRRTTGRVTLPRRDD